MQRLKSLKPIEQTDEEIFIPSDFINTLRIETTLAILDLPIIPGTKEISY
jgi:hypothetical protein